MTVKVEDNGSADGHLNGSVSIGIIVAEAGAGAEGGAEEEVLGSSPVAMEFNEDGLSSFNRLKDGVTPTFGDIVVRPDFVKIVADELIAGEIFNGAAEIHNGPVLDVVIELGIVRIFVNERVLDVVWEIRIRYYGVGAGGGYYSVDCAAVPLFMTI